jgi:MoaA/NifB/PqqE/SkfB family radical SAM enzyme
MPDFSHFIEGDDLVRYGLQPSSPRSSPAFLQVELTDRCNLTCTSCPRSITSSTGKILDLPAFERVLEGLPELTHVSFVGGGEALLVQHFPAFVTTCSRRGIETSTVTNGLLVPARLAAVIEAGLGKLGISIDAAEDHLFRQLRSGMTISALERSVRAALTLAKDSKTFVFGAITLGRTTASTLKSIIAFSADCGLKKVTIQSFHHWGEDKGFNADSLFAGDTTETVAHIELGLAEAVERGVAVSIFDYRRLLSPERYRKCHCSWPLDAAFITCGGDVTPCCVNIEASHGNTLGNVLNARMVDIWRAQPYEHFRASFGTDSEWSSCRDCVYRMEFGSLGETR